MPGRRCLSGGKQLNAAADRVLLSSNAIKVIIDSDKSDDLILDKIGFSKLHMKNLKNNLRQFFLPCEENGGRARIFSGNFLLFFLIGIAVLKIGFALFLHSFSGNPFYADITKTALIDLANYERSRSNLPPLAENPVLNQAAYMKALDMAQGGYFNHVSPSGVNPWHWFSKAGYNYRYAGENLAIGFLDSGEVQKAWTASPTHHANIINNKYQEIGIAVLKANFQGNPATIVVQMFGARSGRKEAAPAGTALSQAPTAPEESEVSARGVLGAQTAAPDQNSAGFKIAQFLARDFYFVMQWTVYLSLVAMILLLLVNFTLKADLAHGDLLAKAVGFVAVMIVFALLDYGLIAALVPRNFVV